MIIVMELFAGQIHAMDFEATAKLTSLQTVHDNSCAMVVWSQARRALAVRRLPYWG